LSAVAVTALLMSVTLAPAEDKSGGAMQGGNSTVMQNNSGGGTLQGGNPGTEGVCPPDQCPQGAAQAPEPGAADTGQALQGEDQDTMPGQASEEQGEDQTGTAAANQRKKPAANDEETQTGTAAANPRKKPAANDKETQTGQNQNADEPQTTGSTNASADITDEQRTEIRSSFHEHHVKPVAHVDFDINVGVAVPTTIVLHPVPTRIVEIVPAYRGYEYFELADGTIVIVDPGSHAIVYVLAA